MTKAILANIKEEVSNIRDSSSIRETSDQTAMATAYDEGFEMGVKSLMTSVDELDLLDLGSEVVHNEP